MQSRDAKNRRLSRNDANSRYSAPVVNYNFPDGFIWGASTSAYQIEGAPAEDGKGRSNWDAFSHLPGKMHNGDTGDVACDHYHKWQSDVRLMKRLGLDAYRFSISWSRVLPHGRGRVNTRGLDFYDRLTDRLLAKGITPFATLYHWDLPESLQEFGRGWLSRDVLNYFADYAAVMVKRLGDRVKHWSTLNEPEVIVAGYTGTSLAPGYNDPSLKHHAGHNLMVAHGLAVRAMRAAVSDLQCGIVLNLVPIYPLDNSIESVVAARQRWSLNYGWYLDALLNGYYPNAVYDYCAANDHIFPVYAGDAALIAQKLDFLGINFYTRFVVDGEGKTHDTPGVERTQMGWEIYPQSLTEMLVAMQDDYNLPPIYITENGAALDDVFKSGHVADSHRINYLHSHLLALRKAVRAGVDVRGYFVWTLMDNLEWSLGFAKTFGLIHVNRKTLKRTVKDSGLWYRDVIAANKRS